MTTTTLPPPAPQCPLVATIDRTVAGPSMADARKGGGGRSLERKIRLPIPVSGGMQVGKAAIQRGV